MAKYYGIDYQAKAKGQGSLDRVALNKTFSDENTERNILLENLTDRINMLLAAVDELKAREAHELAYTDANGERRNIGDMLDLLASVEVNNVVLVDTDGNTLTDTSGNKLVA